MAAVLKPFFPIDIVGTQTIVKADSGKIFFLSSEVQATNILTLTENAANGNTVIVGGKTYTFQATLTNVDGNVHIGAAATNTIDNLIGAITLASGTAGTDYATAMTLHPSITAVAGAGDTMNATAKRAGIAGNSIGATDTLAGSSAWASTTFTGGGPTPSNGNRDIITTLPQDDVDGGNYEFFFRDNGRSRDLSNREYFTSWTISSGLTKPFVVEGNGRANNPYNSRNLLITKGATLEGVKLGGRINDGPGGTVLNYQAGESIKFVSWGSVWYSTPPFGSGFYGIGDF